MTIHASKGQQADYVIIVGLQEGSDGFPAAARESIMEEALLPPVEDFPDAEERRFNVRGADPGTPSGMGTV
ncbi:DNA helicase IV [Escherichia coli]|nr:DNA helicase IV [Escherichia coli]